MSASDWAEFLFFGAFALPAVLAFVSLPAVGVLAFIVLVLGGCLAGSCDPEAPCRVRPRRFRK